MFAEGEDVRQLPISAEDGIIMNYAQQDESTPTGSVSVLRGNTVSGGTPVESNTEAHQSVHLWPAVAGCGLSLSGCQGGGMPITRELCYLMENTYSKKQLLRMERRVLTGLKFDLYLCPSLHFLLIPASVAHCSDKVS
ncbi:cyclin N-terminal domain-containing protein 2 [Myxocyprinus asiaticus]|uniref:cyclin N-terminal domain-containing protein 2 n=1 Tax=Myxocyprinus asiaticus TaxID=70543 RepID=UPI002223AC8C|nr:cyclin N-terminal domain-containing protein 2 [Myxocyprinus asiaticus]